MKIPLTDTQVEFLREETDNYYDELLYRDIPDAAIELFIQVGVTGIMTHYLYLNLSEERLLLYLQDTDEST